MEYALLSEWSKSTKCNTYKLFFSVSSCVPCWHPYLRVDITRYHKTPNWTRKQPNQIDGSQPDKQEREGGKERERNWMNEWMRHIAWNRGNSEWMSEKTQRIKWLANILMFSEDENEFRIKCVCACVGVRFDWNHMVVDTMNDCVIWWGITAHMHTGFTALTLPYGAKIVISAMKFARILELVSFENDEQHLLCCHFMPLLLYCYFGSFARFRHCFIRKLNVIVISLTFHWFYLISNAIRFAMGILNFDGHLHAFGIFPSTA